VKAIKESHANVGFGPLCMLFGKSRYAFYKKDKNRQRWLNEDQTVLEMVAMLRRELPRIGTPKLYYMLKKPLQDHHIKMGRDTLHRLLCDNGLAIRPKRRYVVTTDSRHWMKKYPNLVRNLVVSESEQEWVSDITYIQVGEGFDFLSLITDAYSKQIMGFCLHPTLHAQGSINALRMALDQKTKNDTRHIHHSDRGTQYCCNDYVTILQAAGIEISMTENGDPYENAIAERVNGILKYEFNLNREFVDHNQALEAVQRSIRAYNQLRPHMSCNYLTPVQAHPLKGVLEKKWKPKKRYKVKESLIECF
jgi:transposase InsO family protein